MAFKVVIPARYGSTRLPAKLLLELHGKPVIQWVVEAAARSQAEQVIVATDDARIADAVAHVAPSRVSVAMTRADHRSGTDRIAEVSRQLSWPPSTIIVNVQGDEPQMPPPLIDQTAALLAANATADLATLCTPIKTLEEFLNPSIVKVVRADDNTALYFSRAPIPWRRDGAAQGLASQTRFEGAARHLGIYAYRAAALLRLTDAPPSSLELTENLEQLRALQAGMKIIVAAASVAPGIGVDTAEDIERLRALETFK
jgi:3-deoxy-manno-octulosonate cytidylyltransferase (CMP-KDO synthetase)